MSKNILITGAGTGFGLLTVRTLLDKGYTVYAGIRDPKGRNAERADKVRAHAEGSIGKAVIVDLDVLDEEACRRALDTIVARDGRIDSVFHNAGHLYIGYSEGFTPEQTRGRRCDFTPATRSASAFPAKY